MFTCSHHLWRMFADSNGQTVDFDTFCEQLTKDSRTLVHLVISTRGEARV